MEEFKCKACECTVPANYSVKTEGYCYLCDPNITLKESLDYESPEYLEGMRKAEEETIFDLDDDLPDDEDEPQEPDYWECMGCAKSWGRRPMGGMCTTCGSYVSEGHF